MKTRIRAATEADYQAVRRLYADLQTDQDITADEGDWRALVHHPGTRVFLADVGSEPLAAVTLHVLPNMTYGGRPYALIENVVTAAAQRGRGLGQEIMEHAVEQARAAGCYKVMLLTGRKRGAAQFYEKAGFDAGEKVGMIRRFDQT